MDYLLRGLLVAVAPGLWRKRKERRRRSYPANTSVPNLRIGQFVVWGGKGANEMGIITWIIVGLIAGALAKLVMPGDDPGGIIVTILIGVAGAFVGGLVVGLLGGTGVTGLSIWSILVATLGAIILLAVYRLIARRAT